MSKTNKSISKLKGEKRYASRIGKYIHKFHLKILKQKQKYRVMKKRYTIVKQQLDALRKSNGDA